jgi:hypothetical protein
MFSLYTLSGLVFEVCAYWLAGGMLLEFTYLSVLQTVCVLASVALLLRLLFSVTTYAVSFRHASVRPAHCPRTLFGTICLLIHEAAASFLMCSVRSNLGSACVAQARHMLMANRQSPYYSCTAISAMRRIGSRWPDSFAGKVWNNSTLSTSSRCLAPSTTTSRR